MSESTKTSPTEPEGRDTPGVLAPPPLIFAVPLLLGLLFHAFVGGLDFGWPAALRWPVGVVAILLGGGIVGAALFGFRRAKTNPEPWKPSTALVAEGIYRLSRNPMYLGMALVYGGIAILFDCALTLALLVAALIAIHYGVILREERYLEAKFGEDYRALKRQTRRWL
ncbi:methyltransferase family protein [Jiella marina]|uniref:methyltransferase family protein n=1 Tax=Jiella sp. LLJ827 TaxID=2917712 RepID=UPI002100C151|nr:isoprenylcysteine carboxylmethyltransferase family protein [Jiella sp. LLJ827]MCQ0990479.1 isoprenylcysteine carboxylmethyltransferase family protein [Jiella sp. LLJ827]